MEPPGNTGELLGRALWRRLGPVAALVAFALGCGVLGILIATEVI